MSAAWTVPGPVKKLFDSFPLKEYSSEPVVVQYHNDLRYPLVGKVGVDDDMKSTFQLGVYNVSEFIKDDNVLLPTDPICLSCQLIINLRNGLIFPHKSLQSDTTTTSNNKTSKKFTQNYISVVSYRSSYDNQLPIFIEHESSGKTIVNSTTLINDLQMTRTTLAQLMKCLAVDSVLYDFWIITVLFEMTLLQQSEIYLNSNAQRDPILNKLVLNQTLTSLLSRFGFNNRHVNITKFIEDSHWFHHNANSQRIVDEEKILIIRKSQDLLQLLESSLDNKKFLNNDKPHPGILDCKLAAIIYCVLKFGSETHFGKTLKEFPNLVRHSFEVIEESL